VIDENREKGWHSRGYHPHFDKSGIIQTVTFRLADSLPQEVLKRLEQDLKYKNTKANREYIEECLNKGYGECQLKKKECAEIVENLILSGNNRIYELISWIVMPNHVHVIIKIKQGNSLSNIVKKWKGRSAFEINKMVGRSGSFWQRDYFDRYIRDERHLLAAIEYVHMNPVKSGLASNPEDWEFSSVLKNKTYIDEIKHNYTD